MSGFSPLTSSMQAIIPTVNQTSCGGFVVEPMDWYAKPSVFLLPSADELVKIIERTPHRIGHSHSRAQGSRPLRR
ncbi:hypothetical protein VTO73DRAFT_11308 [Trametes versicolor]